MRSQRCRGAALVAVLLLATVTACTGDSSDDPDPKADATEPTTEPTNQPTTEVTADPVAATAWASEPGELGPGAGLRRYTEQDVVWSDCQSDFECATVRVPVDYDDLTGETVELAVTRLPASDPGTRIGSLLLNPGGPGGSGVDFAQQSASVLFGEEVRAAYDLVGFDPRGVGNSDPIDCVSDDRMDALQASDPNPDSAAEVGQAIDAYRDFAAGCQRDASQLLAHVSTVDVARDLDVLRTVLGEEQLDYVGFSYGTLIGAVYAELFPQRVGRMVLDGAVDPSLDPVELNLAQAHGFQIALEAYVADCVTNPTCPLGTDVDEGLDRLRTFIDGLDAEPLPTDDPDRPLTQALGVIGIAAPLYNKQMWVGLTLALHQALEDGDGNHFLTIVDLYSQRTEDGYANNAREAIVAVNCLDHPSSLTVPEIQRMADDFERVAPTLAPGFAWGAIGCSFWPVKAAAPLPQRIDGAGAAPIVVVGTTRDPATPYAWSVALADQLDSAVLLTRDGDGHTAYGSGSACIDDAVDAYLLDGTVPPDGTSCPPS